MRMSIANPQRFWRSVCGTVKQQLPIQDLSVWTSHFEGVLAPPQETLAFAVVPTIPFRMNSTGKT